MLYNEQEIYKVGNSINQRFKKARINIPKIKGLKLKPTLYEKLKRKSPTTAKVIKNITLTVGCTFGTIIGAIVGIVAVPIIAIVKYERDDIIRNDIVNIIGTIIISPILGVIVGAWIGYIGAKYVITKCLQSTLIHATTNESENWEKNVEKKIDSIETLNIEEINTIDWENQQATTSGYQLSSPQII